MCFSVCSTVCVYIYIYIYIYICLSIVRVSMCVLSLSTLCIISSILFASGIIHTITLYMNVCIMSVYSPN